MVLCTQKGSWYILCIGKNLIVRELESTSFTGALRDGILKIFKGHLQPLRLLGTIVPISRVLR